MPLIAKPPSQRLVDVVGALGGSWSGYSAMCRCPAHADATPSLSLRQGNHDILVHCFAGCDPADVLRELASVVPGKTYVFPDGPARPFDSTAIARNLWSQGRELANTWAEAYWSRRRGNCQHAWRQDQALAGSLPTSSRFRGGRSTSRSPLMKACCS